MQGFIRRHGRKRAWVTHWQTGMYKARQREILGQAWVDDRRTISNRARQRVNPGNTGRNQNMGDRPGQARQGQARQGKARQGKARQGSKARQGKARQGKARQEQFRGLCRVAIARTYAIQYSAMTERKSKVYIECDQCNQLCD